MEFFFQEQNADINSELLGKDNCNVEQLNNSNNIDSVSKNTSIPPQTIKVFSDNYIGEKIRSLYLKQINYLNLCTISQNHIPFLNLLLESKHQHHSTCFTWVVETGKSH